MRNGKEHEEGEAYYWKKAMNIFASSSPVKTGTPPSSPVKTGTPPSSPVKTDTPPGSPPVTRKRKRPSLSDVSNSSSPKEPFLVGTPVKTRIAMGRRLDDLHRHGLFSEIDQPRVTAKAALGRLCNSFPTPEEVDQIFGCSLRGK